MRKIFLLFALMILAISQLQAQTDTVSFPDPWYLYRPLPAAPYAGAGSFYPGMMGEHWLQAFPTDSAVEIYGVACVIDTIHPFKDHPDSCYIPMLYRYERVGSYPGTRIFSVVDSVSFMDNTRHCKFKYVFSDSYETHSPGDTVLDCYEFFFNRPIRSNTINSDTTLNDTIFVGRRAFFLWSTISVWEKRMFLQQDVGYTGIGGTESMTFGTGANNSWGPFFPIVRLRCVKPSLELVGNHGDTAELAVHVVEPSWTSYELSVGDPGSDPDSGSFSSLPAYTSQHTLTGLSPNRHYSAWVRKACHYGTNSYDTIVWSDWSDPVDFFGPIDTTIVDPPTDTTIVDPPTDTTAVDTTAAIPTSHLSPLTSHLTIRPNPASDEVTLLSSYGITAVEAYNAAGTLVFSSRDNSSVHRLSDHALSLDLSSWPRGSYLLRIHTPAGTTTKKLLVQ